VNQSIQESTSDDSLRNRQPTENDDESPHTPRSSSRRPSTSSIGPTIPSGKHAETLQTRTLARLATYADGYDIPVLVTRTKRNDFTASGVTAADHHLECEQTRMGPRVVGDGFETLVYPVDDGAYYQTTFAYWRQLLAARATQVGVEPTTPAPSTPTPEGVGTVSQLTVRRSQPPRIPLLDAWTATGTGGR